MKYDSMINTCC